jgi:nucleoside-diphosphate-sugar epimerase
MNKEGKVYVAGHRGMVGSALVLKLKAADYNNIITRTSAELNLTNQQAVADFFAAEIKAEQAPTIRIDGCIVKFVNLFINHCLNKPVNGCKF